MARHKLKLRTTRWSTTCLSKVLKNWPIEFRRGEERVNPADLIAELAKPAYIGMTAAQKAVALNARTVAVPGTEVYVSREQIRAEFDAAEFLALAAQAQNAVLAVLTSDQVAVEGPDASLLAAAFGAGVTKTALVALRTAAMDAAKKSPAEAIGWGGLTNEVLTDWINKVGA